MREDTLTQYLKSLCKGRKKTVKSTDLARVLHMSQTDLRKCVNRLRRKGVPIASSQDGYFYAVTAGEVYSTIRQLRSMASGLEAAIQGLERSLDEFGGREENP